MKRESKAMIALLLIGVCLALVPATVRAASPEKLRDLRADEIAKIKEAMPSKAERRGPGGSLIGRAVAADGSTVAWLMSLPNGWYCTVPSI